MSSDVNTESVQVSGQLLSVNNRVNIANRGVPDKKLDLSWKAVCNVTKGHVMRRTMVYRAMQSFATT